MKHLERFIQDLRYSIRIFGRTPLFTFIAVASLALGIGANAAVFSLVQSIWFRALPYSSPDRLVRLDGIYPRAAVSYFRERARLIEVAAVSPPEQMNLSFGRAATRVAVSRVSTNFLSVLAVSVQRGRPFKAGEDSPGADGLALISDHLWKHRFGGDPAIIGRVISVDGHDREIVGVLPAWFGYPAASVQVWIPMRLDPTNFIEYWGNSFFPFIARLHRGVTYQAASQEVQSITQAFRKTFPYPMSRDWNAEPHVISLREDVVGNMKSRLLILFAAVGTVLLIVCANLAGLLLSRATTRRKEIALRASLGASRIRVVRQLLTESVALACIGGALGIGVSFVVLAGLRSILPASTPGLLEARIDWHAVLAVTALAGAAGVAFGLAPAISTSRADFTETIKTGAQRSTSLYWTRFRSALIGGEVALTFVLVVSAGLLLKTLHEMSNVDLGFNPDHVLTVRVSPNPQSCVQQVACVALYDRVLTRISELPGVQSAAIVNSAPLDGDLPSMPVDVEGHPRTADHPTPMVWAGAVSPFYLASLQIPLRSGRFFTMADSAASAEVAVVSASFAHRFWPNRAAIGQHVRMSGDGQWRTVVGVVGDVHQYSITHALPDWVAGAIYVPYAQFRQSDGQIPAAMTIIVKTPLSKSRIGRKMSAIATAEAPGVPLGSVESMVSDIRDSDASFRAVLYVFAGFAALSVLLSAMGVYGLMSYWVNQRSYEIALRVAIGASRTQIVAMVLRTGMRVSCWGLLSGVFVSFALTRFLANLLYGAGPTDPVTFTSVALLVLFTASVASGVPAWRASRIKPATALKAD